MIQFIAALALAPAGSAPIKLAQGNVITGSCSVVKRQYLFPSASFNKPSITIKGNGITVDFAGATLRGSKPTIEPDKREGLGILIEGNNITLKNAKILGFKIGLIARKTKGLKLINVDASYNWKQHLESTQENESGADWMFYHHNENNEWYGYGAGLYLRDCQNFEVKGCRVTGGQCGLMLTDSTKGLVWNNDFSFLSGVGIGMFRSSSNRIMHNKVDWCVRGFSYGVYNRGQDSAGILVFDQCSNNVFAYNSVTHGGDGFFLWAGQTTMDTAKGGSNDNLLFGNDFSHAPTNAIEATFSRNKFVNNLLIENWHGVWGGYSYDNEIVGNVFAYNGEGIAIEHGQSNRVAYNVFDRDNAGINTWMQPGRTGWGFSIGKDTTSRDGIIENNIIRNITSYALDLRESKDFKVISNLFERNGHVMRLQDMDGLVFAGNDIYGAKDEDFDQDFAQGNKWTTQDPKAGSPPSAALNRSGRDKPDLDPAFRDNLKRFDLPWNPWPNKPMVLPDIATTFPDKAAEAEAYLKKLAPKPLAGGINPFLPKGTLRGRRYILIDEWGPYDFKQPILWAREAERDPKTGDSIRNFEVLGPKGTWKLVNKPVGVVLSAKSGKVPGKFQVRLPATKTVDLNLQLVYIGGETTDYRGIVTKAGTPIRLGVRDFQMSIDWRSKYYSFDPSELNPLENPGDFAKITSGQPTFEEATTVLSWAGSPSEKVPSQYFAGIAEGSFNAPEGDYTIEITSDDGVRAWLDGKPIVTSGWLHQSPTAYRPEVHLNGKHRLKVEYFQQDGFATLRVRLIPKGAK